MNGGPAYWLFGLVLAGTLTVAIGKPLVAQRGRRILAPLVLAGVLAGLLFGWALDGFVDYASATAQMR